MKALATAFFVALSFAFNAGAVSIWTNPITGSNPNASNPYTDGQTVDPNLTVSGIGRGTGINGANANDRYNANSWDTASLDLTAYFYFTLTPNSGFEVNFNGFTYTGQASATGPSSFVFRSSLDGFTSNIGSPSAGGTTISLAGAQFQGLTDSTEFRFYASGATSSGGTYSINNFTFDGSVQAVASVPESGPGLLVFGIVTAILLTFARQHRFGSLR